MTKLISLAQLGWRPILQQTLTLEQLEDGQVARVLGVDRERLLLQTEQARHCRFKDCNHQGDEGCALSAAIDRGELEPDRVRRFLKLKRETIIAQENVWERRQRYKAFGKVVKKAKNAKDLKKR